MSNAVGTTTIADRAAPGPQRAAFPASVRLHTTDDVPGYGPAATDPLCALRSQLALGVDRIKTAA